MKHSIYILIAFATILFYSCQKDDPIVTAISLDKSEIEIYVGETYQFEVSHISSDAPTPKYKWEVADYIDYRPAGVAKVTDSGLLTALKEGETEVKVSTTEVGDANGQPFVATCRVKVKPVAAAGIKLNKNTLTLKSGETEQLSYTISPENTTYKDVEWKSSDEKVAMVSPLGVVKAIGIGEAIITVNAKKDQAVKAVCNVKTEAMPLNGITLDKDNISAVAGDSIQLNIIFDPVSATNKNVKWSSSDTKVATVDTAGMVRILYPGNCEITAVSEEGQYMAVCKVNVKEVPIESLYLSETKLEMGRGETLKLTVQVYPENATVKDLVWESLSPDIVKVDQKGNMSALQEGEATIRVATPDGRHWASCRITVVNAVIKNVKASTSFSGANIEGVLIGTVWCYVKNDNPYPIYISYFDIIPTSGIFSSHVTVDREIPAGGNISFGARVNNMYMPHYELLFEYQGESFTKLVND